MKTESTVKYVLRIALTLLAITAVVAVILAAVNSVTFPATAPQEKSHVRNWRSKGHLAPLMRPTKFPEIPVSLERNPEVFRHPLL